MRTVLFASCLVASLAASAVEAQTSDPSFCAPYRGADACADQSQRVMQSDFEPHGCACTTSAPTPIGAIAAIGPQSALLLEVATPMHRATFDVDALLAASPRRGGYFPAYIEVQLERVRGARSLVVVRVGVFSATGTSYDAREEVVILVRMPDDAAPEALWAAVGGTRLDCFYDSEEPVDPPCECLSERTVTFVASQRVVHMRSRVRYRDRSEPEPGHPTECVRPASISADIPVP